jgi:hypothetical protein
MVKNRAIRFLREFLRVFFKAELIYKIEQRDINKYIYTAEDEWKNIYPTIIPNWDRSPRSGKAAIVYTNSTPREFRKQIEQCMKIIKNKDDEYKIIFLQSWNEWGEGNYVEPDLKYGKGYLYALRDALEKSNDS